MIFIASVYSFIQTHILGILALEEWNGKAKWIALFIGTLKLKETKIFFRAKVPINLQLSRLSFVLQTIRITKRNISCWETFINNNTPPFCHILSQSHVTNLSALYYDIQSAWPQQSMERFQVYTQRKILFEFQGSMSFALTALG